MKRKMYLFSLLINIALIDSNCFSQSLNINDLDLLPTNTHDKPNSTFYTKEQYSVIKIHQKSRLNKFLEDTSLTYYQQFLGPTLNGPSDVTYNVFQEGIDSPGTGFAPLQSFHSFNLRHQINTEWAIGTTLSASNGYSSKVQNLDINGSTFENSSQTQYFNTRLYLSLPKVNFKIGTLFTTLSYEHPTSNTSKENEMKWGWIAAQSFAFNFPSLNWNFGLMGQAYRMYYKNNIKLPTFATELGGRPIPMQTIIVSGGPYLNYRITDQLVMGSLITFDWDQRGLQTGSTKFNNNLSDRARLSLTYYPKKLFFFQSIGIFSQMLLKYSAKTTALGADFSLRF